MIATIRSKTLGPSGVASTRRDVLRRLGSIAALGAMAATGVGDPTAAKRKKGGGSSKKRGQTVTQTFANPNAILINASGSASPFPSPILVSGFKDAKITDVDLVLKGFSHEFPRDVDVMLVAPFGRNALVMSDVGGLFTGEVSGLTLRLDDAAGADLPSGLSTPLTSGAFRPTNNFDDNGMDNFDTTSAPFPSGSVALSTFNGGDPNGEWRLFINDDTNATFAGSISGGWELTITATTAATKKRKKQKKKR